MKRLQRMFVWVLLLGLFTFLVAHFHTLQQHVIRKSPRFLAHPVPVRINKGLQEPKPNMYGVKQTRLIVLAYMRTGSSMTGSIFNSHPEVFYWFEPLHDMGRVHGNANRHIEKWEKRRQFASSDEAAGNISALLSCDVKNVFRRTLLDAFMRHSAGTKPFHDCFKISAKGFLSKDSNAAWDRCIDDIGAACMKNYSVVALKTIRFRMSRALDLMRSDPSLKVLHIVRDPRAVLESKRRLGYANYSDLKQEASMMCSDITNDLNVAQKINNEDIKQRYMLVRYEDVASSPKTMAEEFLKFVGLKPNDEVLSFADKLSKTAPGKRKRCPTCKAESANSTARSQEWRYASDIKDVQVISDECGEFLSQLGYHDRFKNEAELRDFDITAVGKPLLNVASSVVRRQPSRT